MTVSSTTTKSGPYNGNGSTTVFAYAFHIFDETHLEVVLTSSAGVETVQTLTTHYTVSGVDVAGGGNVTMLTAPASGETLTIRRVVPLTQLTDLQNQGGVFPETLEDAYDKLTYMVQYLDEMYGRTLKLQVSDSSGADVEADTPVAGEVLIWDATLKLASATAAALGTAILSDIDPVAAAAAASPGTGVEVSRNDHVHPMHSDVAETLTNKTLDDFTNDVHANAVHVQVRNVTGSTIPVMSVVYVSGASGQTPTIALAGNSSDATSSSTIGVTSAAIENNATGQVILKGVLEGMDTSAFVDGDVVYLDTVAGALTDTKPATPEHLVTVGYVAYAHATQGKLFIAVQNGWELSEVHDVLITAIADGEFLVWDAANSYWKNQTATEITSLLTAAGIIHAGTSDTLTVGMLTSSHNLGNLNGATTLSIANGNIQHGTMTGSFTLTAPNDTDDGYCEVELTIDATGGYTLTLSGFNEISGTADMTANAVNLLRISKLNTNTYLEITQAV